VDALGPLTYKASNARLGLFDAGIKNRTARLCSASRRPASD
jgi:hypothetical protein